MLCPSCKREFTLNRHAVCPHCGKQITAGVVKSSTILISAGGTQAVYRSVEDVPPALRDRLLETTNSLNSATIIIADRRGRKEIAKAIRNLPLAAQRRLAGIDESGISPSKVYTWLVRAIGGALFAGTGLLLWLLFR